VDWEKVEAEANTKIPERMTYTLTWGSLRSPGMTLNTRISRQNPPKPAVPSG
jgi:hypothetical protein